MSDLNNKSLNLVDMSVLQSLKAYARSPAFMPQLVGIFEEHGRSSLIELRMALSDQDVESVRRVAHRFKGSCLNMGAQALASELKLLESFSPDTKWPADRVETTYHDLTQLFDTTCNYLKSLN
ncbi:MAG: Hpt domain-containing protein [Proteobacteria bacterium]|nr:MAG: Hpt domain-containing protein [Pseudomonadota bacterium]